MIFPWYTKAKMATTILSEKNDQPSNQGFPIVTAHQHQTQSPAIQNVSFSGPWNILSPDLETSYVSITQYAKDIS